MKRRMSIKRALTKALSLFLSVLIVFFATPSVLYAEAIDAIGKVGNSEASSDEADVYSYSGAAYEVEELREERVKHFLALWDPRQGLVPWGSNFLQHDSGTGLLSPLLHSS